MDNLCEQVLIEQATSPARLLELNRMFQLLHAKRLQEIILEQQLNQLQQQNISSTVIETPPSSPLSSISENQDQSFALTYGDDNNSTAKQSSSPELFPAWQQPQPLKKRRTTKRIRFDPYQMSRRPCHLSAVSVNNSVEIDMLYHESMARRLRPTDCTPEEIERRDQCAFAARVSRAKKRVLQSLLEKEHDEVAQQNRSQKQFVAQKRVYAAELLHLLGLPPVDLVTEWENVREWFEKSLCLLEN